MDAKIFLAAACAMLLLLAGCTAEPKTDAGNMTNAAAQPAQTAPQNTQQAQEQPPVQPQNTTATSQETGKASGSLVQLRAQGKPVTCIYAMKGSDTRMLTLYVKGDKTRIAAEGSGYTNERIFTDAYGYILTSQKGTPGECDWNQVEKSSVCYKQYMLDQMAQFEPVIDRRDALDGMEEGGYHLSVNCSYAAFGDDVFQPQGTICPISGGGNCDVSIGKATDDAEVAASKAYWKADARPFSIPSYSQSGSALALKLLDTEANDNLQLTGVKVSGTQAGTYSQKLSFAPGESKDVQITMSAPCKAGEKYRYKVEISYTSSRGIESRELPPTQLVGICS